MPLIFNGFVISKLPCEDFDIYEVIIINIGKLVGKRIQELLFKNGMTVYRLSKITCLRERTISNLIYGRSNDVKMSTLYLISNAFNMDILEFLSPEAFRNKNVDI